MSSGSRLVSNAGTRRLLMQSNRRLSHAISHQLNPIQSLRHSRNAPSQLNALAILIPRRGYATETTTHSNNEGPPPGFNINEAKKPIPKEKGNEEKNEASTTSKLPTPLSVSELRDSDEKTSMPQTSATFVDKSAAREKVSLSELAAEKSESEGKSIEKTEEVKKLTIGQKIMREIHHYWDGTKLLATEVRISTKLAFKMAAGYELSRRENRQLQRTVQDLGRLVPFSVFVIVPFAELLLPIALKLFPNLLPSTYEGVTSREAKATHLRKTRQQISEFLRNTLRETGLPVVAVDAKKEEFQKFFMKVRASGEQPTREDVIKVSKLFKDDLTLDNLSRPQLVGMCRYMNLGTFGTDAMLRYTIRHRMRQIKRDDKAISYEGVDSLSIPELQMACASRGLRTHGMTPGRLREDLQLWLDLRLKYNIPSTLLVLSNAYLYTSGQDTEVNSQIDALQAVLSSIPEELFHEIELEVHNAEGAATNKQRLEVLKEQQELINEENKQSESSKSSEDKEASSGSQVKDDKDIDPKPKAQAKAEDMVEAEAKQNAAEESKQESTEGTKEATPTKQSESGAAEEAREAETDVSEQGKKEERRMESDVKKD